jgi:hypothetical protein
MLQAMVNRPTPLVLLQRSINQAMGTENNITDQNMADTRRQLRVAHSQLGLHEGKSEVTTMRSR